MVGVADDRGAALVHGKVLVVGGTAGQVDQDGGALVDDVGLGYPVYIAAGEFVLLERLPERSTHTGPTEE